MRKITIKIRGEQTRSPRIFILEGSDTDGSVLIIPSKGGHRVKTFNRIEKRKRVICLFDKAEWTGECRETCAGWIVLLNRGKLEYRNFSEVFANNGKQSSKRGCKTVSEKIPEA